MGKHWLACAGVRMEVLVVVGVIEAATIKESADWLLKYWRAIAYEPPDGIVRAYENWIESPLTTFMAENTRWSSKVPVDAALNKPHSVMAKELVKVMVATDV